MTIKKVQERIKSNYTDDELKSYSKFFLVDYSGNGKERDLNEVLPIENTDESFSLEKDFVITDKDGEVLLEGFNDEEIVVYAVNDNKILVNRKISRCPNQ